MRKICFIFFLLISSVNLFSQGEVTFLRSLNKNNMPCWDKTMKGVSFSAYPVSFAVPIGILAHGYFTKDRELIRNGYKSVITIVMAIGISTALKKTIERERPFVKYPNDIIKRDNVSSSSFPSGHTTTAFASATSLSLTYKKWYVTIPSYAYACMVGYSRMRLGMHYPSDVLGGMILGIGSGLLTWQLDKLILRRKTNQAKKSSIAE